MLFLYLCDFFCSHMGDFLSLAHEIECFFDARLCSGLVDADVANVPQQGEVDASVDVFLVVAHQFKQFGIVVAGDGQFAVVVADIGHGGAHLLGGEVGE